MSAVPLGVMCREPETENRVCGWEGVQNGVSCTYQESLYPPPPWNSPMPVDLGRRIAVP